MRPGDQQTLARLGLWAEGRAAARAGLEASDCPHPWQPGWDTPYLEWIRGLADGYEEMGASTKAARSAQRAKMHAKLHASATARPWSPFRLDGTVPVWFVRLMRKLFA